MLKHLCVCGVLALCGIHDAEAKPILLCSCNDNSVRLYDLPSFTERGRLFAKQEVRAIQIGPGGLFFTGDATGQLAVWKLAGESSSVILS
ncbi:Zinc finger CCCH domain-containing protein 48 [Camellia lanceoleosa]|uniref:Zinc finger CCCH domain-containing protein 48 n=1 Tax=Camellia lanceoleosa TaxID=1840588 RepID=A0ACC0IQ25_9ERIC|nr:Zinc finger CCCH domain-containing protein 48 [Camellia lanceoleosa]